MCDKYFECEKENTQCKKHAVNACVFVRMNCALPDMQQLTRFAGAISSHKKRERRRTKKFKRNGRIDTKLVGKEKEEEEGEKSEWIADDHVCERNVAATASQ